MKYIVFRNLQHTYIAISMFFTDIYPFDNPMQYQQPVNDVLLVVLLDQVLYKFSLNKLETNLVMG